MSKAAHLLDRRVIFRHDRDHPWNGCGTITTDGSVILASWYTGGYKEPHPDNHVVLSRSFDGGATWEPPTVVSDPPATCVPATRWPGATTAAPPISPTATTVPGHRRLALLPHHLPRSRRRPARLVGAGTGAAGRPRLHAQRPSAGRRIAGSHRSAPDRGCTQAGALLTRDRGASWQLVGRTPHMTRSGLQRRRRLLAHRDSRPGGGHVSRCRRWTRSPCTFPTATPCTSSTRGPRRRVLRRARPERGAVVDRHAHGRGR